MLMLNGLFVMFMGQQVVTHAAVQAAKSMAYDPYSTERVDNSDQKNLMTLFSDMFTWTNKAENVSTRKWYSDESSRLKSVAERRLLAYLDQNDAAAEKALTTLGVNSISFAGCKVEDDVLTYEISYKQDFIFSIGGLGSFDRTISVKVKLFKWSKLPNTIYEVSFDSKGGSLVTNKITDQSNGSLPEPTKPGFEFVGWSSDPNSKTPDIKSVEDAKNVGENGDGSDTLYAVWKPVSSCTYVASDTKMNSIGEKGVEGDLKGVFNFDALKKDGYKTVKITITFKHSTDDKHNLRTTLLVGDKEMTWNQHFDENSKTLTYTYDVPIDSIKNASKFQVWWDLEGEGFWDAVNNGPITNTSIKVSAYK